MLSRPCIGQPQEAPLPDVQCFSFVFASSRCTSCRRGISMRKGRATPAVMATSCSIVKCRDVTRSKVRPFVPGHIYHITCPDFYQGLIRAIQTQADGSLLIGGGFDFWN